LESQEHLFLDLRTQLSESILNHTLDLVGSMWVLIKINRDVDLVLPDDGLSSAVLYTPPGILLDSLDSPKTEAISTKKEEKNNLESA
jgi:hypothetical protein